MFGTIIGLGVSIWIMIGQLSQKRHVKRLPTKTYGCYALDLVNTTTYSSTFNGWSSEYPSMETPIDE